MEHNGEKVTKEVKGIVQHYDDLFDLMKNVTSVSENLDLLNMSVCLGQNSESPGYFFWDDHATQSAPEKFVSVSVNGDYYWSTKLGQVPLAGDSTHNENASKKLTKLANGVLELG